MFEHTTINGNRVCIDDRITGQRLKVIGIQHGHTSKGKRNGRVQLVTKTKTVEVGCREGIMVALPRPDAPRKRPHA
jgi:hypothetical protein